MSTRFARAGFAIAAVATMIVLAGCSSSGSSFTGDWGQVAPGKPSLTIKSDGSFSGTDGCNPLKGQGSISGDTFTFGPFASTLKACEGVTPWLNLAATAKVDGNTLTVYRSGDTKIGTLQRR
ncbi:META domain-containing protein [Leifsonia sp. 21MFCrub1.1]|uniref:META domain-containing protein n=1 Tax=Leifsonia sp. 21MFCrub1.1 TaxID=1798223 RepID=UPI0008928C0E|nr:META domain-containing protein [Leifsonia sp. 21MFCrub1.1]SEA91943.1 Heat shock protein HslJ [Leifsonia sp. 21MFCrub1.1]